jgi:hypothetical protein
LSRLWLQPKYAIAKLNGPAPSSNLPQGQRRSPTYSLALAILQPFGGMGYPWPVSEGLAPGRLLVKKRYPDPQNRTPIVMTSAQ